MTTPTGLTQNDLVTVRRFLGALNGTFKPYDMKHPKGVRQVTQPLVLETGVVWWHGNLTAAQEEDSVDAWGFKIAFDPDLGEYLMVVD